MADWVTDIINKIENGTYNTVLIKETAPYAVHGDQCVVFPAFPDARFKGACLIRLTSDFRKVPYSIFIRDNSPRGLYHGIDAKHMLKSRMLLDVNPNELREIDTNFHDLQGLWNVISVIENNKRQK